MSSSRASDIKPASAPARKTSLSWSLYGIIALFAAGMIVLAGFSLFNLRTELLSDRKHELKSLVDVAMSIVKAEHERARKGNVTEAEAKAEALRQLSRLRYGADDYVWVNDMHPRMVMHPMRPELNGRDLTTNKDPNGKALFVEFVNAVSKDGAGFVDYEWPRPGVDKPQPKLSYVNGFAPWGWVIGTGVYVDDISARFMQAGTTLAMWVIVMFAGLMVLPLMISRKLVATITRMTNAMKALAHGDTSLDIPDQNRTDELGDMAAALVVFRNNAIERNRLEQDRIERDATLEQERIKAHQLADELDAALNTLALSVANSARQMTSSADDLSDNASRTKNDTSTAIRTVVAA